MGISLIEKYIDPVMDAPRIWHVAITDAAGHRWPLPMAMTYHPC